MIIFFSRLAFFVLHSLEFLLPEQVAVQEYLDEKAPKALSRAALKGNTKAKQRARRAAKQGSKVVLAKGLSVDQADLEVHAAGGFKHGVQSFRRKQFIPSVDDD